jgi:NADP-dependent 3-hydroxy acid dehydrogenase YdfG
MGRLTDKVVIITGAGDGLGEVMAHLFAKEGAHLTLAGRRTELLEKVAAAVRADGGRAIARTTDVTDEGAVIAMVADTVSEYGHVDVMCNRPGPPHMGADARELERHDRRRCDGRHALRSRGPQAEHAGPP